MRVVFRKCGQGFRSTMCHLFLVLAILSFIMYTKQRQELQNMTREEVLRSLKVMSNETPNFSTPFPFTLKDNIPLPHGDWQEAAGSHRDVFLYSAYLDRRANNSHVVIIAIVRKEKKASGCRVWTGNVSSETTALTQRIHALSNLAYISVLVLCPVPRDSLPTHVALLAYPETRVPVQDMGARVQEGRMSVCVKPMHSNLEDAMWMVEFIEFYRLLGADRFIFYNYSTGPRTEAVVNHYMDKGVVTLLPWSLPVKSKTEIRVGGLFAALNDCNLRSVNRFTFTAMVDFDEFLIPRKHDTLLDLLASYGDKDSAYIFKNTFFYLYWENDTSVAYERLRKEGVSPVQGPRELFLRTAFKTRRLDESQYYGLRSKYVVRPERVHEVCNHIVWKYIVGKGKKVPDSDGLSHHYRACEFGGFGCLKKPSHVDRTAHAWLSRVYSRVVDQCAEIFHAEGTCPPPHPLPSPH